jgi:hypothetical protein
MDGRFLDCRVVVLDFANHVGELADVASWRTDYVGLAADPRSIAEDG